MRWLRTFLAINGAVFLLRASLNIVEPSNFYLEPDAPDYAKDAVRVLGFAYLALGLIQLGMLPVRDRSAIRVVAAASMLFAAAVFIQAMIQGVGPADAFHRLRPGPAAENGLVALFYAILLLRKDTARTKA